MNSESARLLLLFGGGALLVLIVGFYGLLMTRNLIRALIAVEILAKAATLLLVTGGYLAGRTGLGQALAITLIVVEVAVIGVAVGIVLGIYRHSGSLDASDFATQKGPSQ
jgi:NADH:ubiquinone oxidoreductase subunit K